MLTLNKDDLAFLNKMYKQHLSSLNMKLGDTVIITNLITFNKRELDFEEFQVWILGFRFIPKSNFYNYSISIKGK
jgi:hypothetical protein